MGELAADAEEVVLLLELEDTCLQIVWDVLSHLLALHTFSHLILVSEAKQAGHTVAVTPYFCLYDFVLVVGLQDGFVGGEVRVGQYFALLHTESLRNVPLLDLAIVNQFVLVVLDLFLLWQRLWLCLLRLLHYRQLGEFCNSTPKCIQFP